MRQNCLVWGERASVFVAWGELPVNFSVDRLKTPLIRDASTGERRQNDKDKHND
jgi:hypothetical protein